MPSSVPIPGVNDLASQYPLIAAEADGWDPTKFKAGSNKVLPWKCREHGHSFETSPNKRTGNYKGNCPICTNQKILIGFNDLNHTHPIIAKEAYEWDPTEYVAGSNKKMRWVCKEGHDWDAKIVDRAIKGHGCPFCSNNKVWKGFNDIETKFPELAKEAQDWDPSTELPGSNKKRDWKCKKCGHEWKAMPNARTKPNGTGCPKCAGNLLLTLKQCQDHAKSNGGLCLSTEYNNAREKIRWKCSCDYEWESSASNVLGLNSWCPKCAGNLSYELSDLHKLAKERGGKCRSIEYNGAHSNYDWTCSDGHEWSASFASLRRGDWCPHCKFNYKEEVTRLIFERSFEQKFPRIRPEWLINEDGHRMEIDGCNLELSIGFEYNGRQHYQEGHFGMDSEKLKKRIRDDECKERLCKEHGIDLMIVKYTDELKDIPSLVIDYYGDRVVYRGDIDYSKVHQYASALNRLREIAEGKKGLLISTIYEGGRKKHAWECELGHQWDATPEAIVAGTWCPICSNKQVLAGFNDLKTKYPDVAAEADGWDPETVLPGSNTKRPWKCKTCGHLWSTQPNHRTGSRSSGCPECAKKKMGSKKKRKPAQSKSA